MWFSSQWVWGEISAKLREGSCKFRSEKWPGTEDKVDIEPKGGEL